MLIIGSTIVNGCDFWGGVAGNMVKIGLQLKAILDGITALKPSGADFRWYLKVRCNSCGSENDKLIYISLLMEQPLKGGRGTANVVMKCKLCSRENSISILEDTITSYDIEDSGKFKMVVSFDCRGLEPIYFEPRSGFTANGVDSDTVFSDIDLTTKEWTEYDEKATAPVSIFEVEHKFIKL